MRAEFDANTVQLATRIPKALHVRTRVQALEAHVTMAEWVNDAIVTHLERCTGKKRSRPPTKPAKPGPNAAA